MPSTMQSLSMPPSKPNCKTHVALLELLRPRLQASDAEANSRAGRGVSLAYHLLLHHPIRGGANGHPLESSRPALVDHGL
mmetsp:Transcript_41215/g.108886  ORF Transcript_41215/g.108886 Transcript_41215/m.108886 type:complete len:80 (-) Transcript_41215:1204-1443(-)